MDAIEQGVEAYPYLAACSEQIKQTVAELTDTFSSGGKVLLCGNGGSASDCEHIAGEFMKGFLRKRPLTQADQDKLIETCGSGSDLSLRLQRSLPAISLVSQTGLMTAIANDQAPELIFAQQVYGYGKKGDVLLGITTSGQSANVLRAFEVGRAFGLKTVCLTGKRAVHLERMCDIVVRAPFSTTQEIQQCHMIIYHLICAQVEQEIFPS